MGVESQNVAHSLHTATHIWSICSITAEPSITYSLQDCNVACIGHSNVNFQCLDNVIATGANATLANTL